MVDQAQKKDKDAKVRKGKARAGKRAGRKVIGKKSKKRSRR